MSGWITRELAGRPADVLLPHTASPRGVLVFLHPYDSVTLKQQPVWTALLESTELVTICPHGPCCWWTDQRFEPFNATQSPLDWLRAPLLADIATHWQLEPPHIALLGIEMGGQGVLQWAYRAGREFPVVVAISPKVDFETWYGYGNSLDQIFPDREAARQATCLLQLHPFNWPRYQLLLCDPADVYCFAGTSKLVGKLGSSGVLCEHDLVSSHGGYGWEYANHMAPRALSHIRQHLPLKQTLLEPD